MKKRAIHFLYVPIADQLKTLLARDGISEGIGKRTTTEGVYSDIYSGSMYKAMFSDSHHSNIDFSGFDEIVIVYLYVNPQKLPFGPYKL